jgi:hypothetical protein
MATARNEPGLYNSLHVGLVTCLASHRNTPVVHGHALTAVVSVRLLDAFQFCLI